MLNRVKRGAKGGLIFTGSYFFFTGTIYNLIMLRPTLATMTEEQKSDIELFLKVLSSGYVMPIVPFIWAYGRATGRHKFTLHIWGREEGSFLEWRD